MSTVWSLTPFLAGAADAELEDWGPSEEATGPARVTSGVELWSDGDCSAGSWACEPGPSYWVQTEHEVIHVVAGRMAVTPEGGADRGRHRRRRGLRQGLDRHVGDPRADPRGLRDLPVNAPGLRWGAV